MIWYLNVIRKYAVFQGRSRRTEYWMFEFINFLISLAFDAIDVLITHKSAYPFQVIYSLALIIPTLAVTIRRLHDTNRSGWNVLWGIVPLVGWIVLLVYLVSDSQPGGNQYGPNPKN